MQLYTVHFAPTNSFFTTYGALLSFICDCDCDFVSGCTRGVQVKLWDPLRTRAIPERLRGVFTTRHYTNLTSRSEQRVISRSPFPSSPSSFFHFLELFLSLNLRSSIPFLPLSSPLFLSYLLIEAASKSSYVVCGAQCTVSSKVEVEVDHKRSSGLGHNCISVIFRDQRMCPVETTHGRHSFLEGWRVWSTFSFTALLIVFYYFQHFGRWSSALHK